MKLVCYNRLWVTIMGADGLMMSQDISSHNSEQHLIMLARVSSSKPIYLGGAHFDGLVQDYNNSIANTLESLQSCTKPSIYIALRMWVNKQHLFSGL